MSSNTPNLATSMDNNTINTTTPRTSIEEITPKTATCTEQLLALAAASHASADMAASSTHEVEEDENQEEESSSVKQLLPVTSPIKIANGPSTYNNNSNIEEKVPTPDKASSSNSQMSPTTAIKITEAQTPKHCNKSPYNTLTTTTTGNNNTKSVEGNTNTTNNVSGPNPIGKQLNPNNPARSSKPIKQYWPTRYSTINTNERRIQAELGNYSTSYVEGENERERRIKERDARDFAQQQQRNIYEQQQQYVNAHRYDGYYNGTAPTHNYPHHHMAGTSSSTNYPHHYQPMPQFVQKYSNSHEKYHYEGSRYPPHYEGYPPSHHLTQGGYYGSPSNYQHHYNNVAGYSAAMAPHHAPPQATYGNTTGGYGSSYQDKEVPLSTVPSTEDRSKDGSLHAVSSSFSNEGAGKVMQSPGVVTRNGSGSVGGTFFDFVVHILCMFCTLQLLLTPLHYISISNQIIYRINTRGSNSQSTITQ